MKAVLCQTDILIIDHAQVLTAAVNSHSSERMQVARTRSHDASCMLGPQDDWRTWKIWRSGSDPAQTHTYTTRGLHPEAAWLWWSRAGLSSLWLMGTPLLPLLHRPTLIAFCFTSSALHHSLNYSLTTFFLPSIYSTHIHPLRPEAEMPRMFFFTTYYDKRKWQNTH